jgi:hypothetical protein
MVSGFKFIIFLSLFSFYSLNDGDGFDPKDDDDGVGDNGGDGDDDEM